MQCHLYIFSGMLMGRKRWAFSGRTIAFGAIPINTSEILAFQILSNEKNCWKSRLFSITAQLIGWIRGFVQTICLNEPGRNHAPSFTISHKSGSNFYATLLIYEVTVHKKKRFKKNSIYFGLSNHLQELQTNGDCKCCLKCSPITTFHWRNDFFLALFWIKYLTN